ncbi:LytR/AlgR family response regulator transcription factor [Desulfovibrio inopinatus]|uniref:LytR/AlgR family response regulator transcription factor n=1 Tax=Desulfovibrio inopinatus TaxID=102109 RepID=UPI000481143F|nr:LytTR family DNA-binding domain-containing protein [Desulfovibrio inopinatus]
MSHITTLLLHSDPNARASLRKLLHEVDFIRVVGEAVSAAEALELLEGISYGLFFVGVELDGGVSGIELAQMLAGRKKRPGLVFLAENESLAFTAFELGAVDYLLLPIASERFHQTVERLSRMRSAFKDIPTPSWRDDDGEEDREQTVQLPLGEEEEGQFISALRQAWDPKSLARPLDIEKLPISMDGRTILLPYDQIIFVEAYEDYSFVHTASKKILTSFRLKNLEERLKPFRFFRVHRKYLVNLDMVTEIASLPGGNFMLRTMGKTRIELPISRRRIPELKQILGL